ncbi:unnamed protein product, partial [Rotaria socialis]
ADGSPAIKHGQAVKLLIETPSGELVDRLSPWSRYVQVGKNTNVYHGVFYNPPVDQVYKFK